jgi:hypothetical protein
MQDPYSRSVGSASFSILLASLRYAALTVLLTSCSANLPVQRDAQQADGGVRPAPFSIVCIIHGDGDYLYHDTSGIAYNAALEALAGAQSIARLNPQAEVFIFHRRAREHFLFVFPRHDGEFYYYRNGRLIANESYWRDQEQSPLDPEVGLYHRFRENNERKTVSLFLYFGHDIPEFGGAGYDESYPDRPFTVHDLAGTLKAFTRDSKRFDLMLLSTCFGGTPYTIGLLGSFARYIVASPENLHLSYFDLQPLQRLDLTLGDGDVHAFAEKFARRSFDRLTKEIQTAVSVGVYDVDHAQEFLHSVHGTYDETLSTLEGEGEAYMTAMEHCDCADLPAYVLPTMSEGVNVFYRPARFGRAKHKQTHSGWECWRYATEPGLREMGQR